MEFMEKALLPVAAKLAGQRHLLAVRDAFIMFMPLTIAAAFAVLINWTILGPNWYGLANVEVYGEAFVANVQLVRNIFAAISDGTLGMIAFFIPMGIGYNLAKSRDAKNPFVVAMMVGAVFMILIPMAQVFTTADGATMEVYGWISRGVYFGATNLFTSLIVGLLFGELILWLMRIDALQIKMPDSVPPMVSNAFSALIPAFITFVIAGIVYFLFANFGLNLGMFGATDLSGFVSKLLQEPILAFANGIGGPILAFLYVFLSSFFWLFGIHGPNVLQGVSQPVFGVMQAQNQTIYQLTGDAFNGVMTVGGKEIGLSIFGSAFFDAYCFMGGSGLTIGLIIAIFIFSKRADYKAIAGFSVAPGLFNINEPIIFGMPIVLNPILGIPFVLAPTAAVILPWLLTAAGILPKVVISAPWVTPPVLGAFLATGGNFLAALVAIANIAIAVVIYIPFVILANKSAAAEAGAETL